MSQVSVATSQLKAQATRQFQTHPYQEQITLILQQLVYVVCVRFWSPRNTKKNSCSGFLQGFSDYLELWLKIQAFT